MKIQSENKQYCYVVVDEDKIPMFVFLDFETMKDSFKTSDGRDFIWELRERETSLLDHWRWELFHVHSKSIDGYVRKVELR